MRELRDTVGRLEGNIAGLTQLVEALCSNTTALQQLHQQQQEQQQAAVPVEDAFSLLKQVRYLHFLAHFLYFYMKPMIIVKITNLLLN